MWRVATAVNVGLISAGFKVGLVRISSDTQWFPTLGLDQDWRHYDM